MLRAVAFPFGIGFGIVDVGKIFGSGSECITGLNDIEEYRKCTAEEGNGDQNKFCNSLIPFGNVLFVEINYELSLIPFPWMREVCGQP